MSMLSTAIGRAASPASMATSLGPGVLLAEALAWSLLTGMSAQIEFRLPFTPVPITGQSLAVLVTGAVLGSRWGGVSMFLYLAEGCLGLPFFAGGAAGPLHLLGPTGGYLLGFVPAAWTIGKLTERGWDRTPWSSAAMLALGSAVIFGFGLAGLARFVSAGRLVDMGLTPFLPGDLFKIALAALGIYGGRRLSGVDFKAGD